MKNFIKYILQKIFGLNNYLYLFARFMILKLPFDKNEKDFLKFIELIENSDHVLDIGANIGVMTYHFATKLDKAIVHSFEPVPINYKVMQRVIDKYKLANIRCYSYALGESSGEVNMIMPEQRKVFFHGLSHVNSSNSALNGKSFQVQMEKLDNISEFKNIKINAIKLDVEDYEYSVLKGAESLIKENRPFIYTELWESENKEKSFSFLNSLNYRSFINIKNHLTEYSGQKGYQNYFFIPSEHCDNLKL